MNLFKQYNNMKLMNESSEAFHPNQIKSSIGNNGKYSSKSDNITENSN